MVFTAQVTSIVARSSPIPLLRAAQVSHPERRVATGELVRVRRGVLASTQAWRALAPWDRYLARVHAAVLTHPGLILTHESAAALRGLPVFGDPVLVHVLDSDAATARSDGGIRVHTTSADRQLEELGGHYVTSAIDTTVDLARARGGAVGLSVADAALRADPTLSVEMLVAANESRSSSRGRRHARWALHRATPLAESALESISRGCVEWLGFEDPALQREFRSGGILDRGDMWFEALRVVAEADGDLKFDGSLQDPVLARHREQERDRRLLRHARAVVHWGWSDVARIDPVRSILRGAGLRPVRPENSLELAALRTLLRPSRPSA